MILYIYIYHTCDVGGVDLGGRPKLGDEGLAMDTVEMVCRGMCVMCVYGEGGGREGGRERGKRVC